MIQVENKKTVIIVAISIGLIVLLSLLLFSPQVFVGKAIESGQEVFDVKVVDEKMVVSLTSSTRNVAAISFDLSSTSFVCGDLTGENILGWEFFDVSCANDVFTFGLATIIDFQTGTFDALNIIGTQPETFDVLLEKVNVYGTDGTLLFEDGSGSFSLPEAPEVVITDTGSSSSSGGGGGGSGRRASGEFEKPKVGHSFTCLREWECSEWVACSNSLQTRTCVDKNNCQKTKTVDSKTYPVVQLGKNKPVESQSCVMPVVPKVQEPAPVVEEKSALEVIWEEKKVYVVVPSIIILIVCGFVLFHLFWRKSPPTLPPIK
jgi:hypothetical protein